MKTRNRLTIYVSILAFVMVACGQPGNESKQTLKEDHKEEHDHSAHRIENTETKKKPKSPKTATMANIGNNHVHIEYGSPSVRGRVIWGGLVPYGEVWASGAHNATSVNFSADVIIGGVDIPKGKYAFFTIPGKESWTIIINKNWDQHLAEEYDESDDLVRLSVIPEENDFVEALRYSVMSDGNSNGYIHFEWEKLILAIRIENKQ